MSRISVRTLSCGLTLIVETIPSVRSAGLLWAIPAGSATDPENLQGRSAMWEYLLLRGAGNLDSRQQADAFDALGVSRGTGVQTFNLTISATMLGARVLDALPLITDMALKPRFDDASIEPVRDLCIQSIESLEDDPQERVSILLKDRHAPAPLNRSGLGTIEGLEQLDRDLLVQGWMERCRPQGSVLALAGAVKIEDVAPVLEKLFETWEGRAPEPGPRTNPPRGAHHEHDDTNQVHIALAHDAPAESSADAPLERVVNAVHSGGMSGRLFTEVREKRSLCYSVYASYATERDYGRVVSYAGTTPERAQETLDVLLGELRRINGSVNTGGGVEHSEFDRAITGLKSRIVMSGESTDARAAALAADWRRLGRPRSLADLTAEIESVTRDAVNDYLARRNLGRMTLATVGSAELKVDLA